MKVSPTSCFFQSDGWGHLTELDPPIILVPEPELSPRNPYAHGIIKTNTRSENSTCSYLQPPTYAFTRPTISRLLVLKIAVSLINVLQQPQKPRRRRHDSPFQSLLRSFMHTACNDVYDSARMAHCECGMFVCNVTFWLAAFVIRLTKFRWYSV